MSKLVQGPQCWRFLRGDCWVVVGGSPKHVYLCCPFTKQHALSPWILFSCFVSALGLTLKALYVCGVFAPSSKLPLLGLHNVPHPEASWYFLYSTSAKHPLRVRD